MEIFYCACGYKTEDSTARSPHAQTAKTKSIADATKQRCVGMVQNKAADATKQRCIVTLQRNEKPSQQSCWKGFLLKIRWRRPTLPLAQYHQRGRA